MGKLVDALYHQRRGALLLAGHWDPAGWVDAGEGRRWRVLNISSLSRGRGRLGADRLHMLFDAVAGPVGAHEAAEVFCCGLRVISVDGSTTDVPDTAGNVGYFGRPSNATRKGAFPQVRWCWQRPSRAPAHWSRPPSGPTPAGSRLWRATCWRGGARDAGVDRP